MSRRETKVTVAGEVESIVPLSVPDLRGDERDYLVRCIDDNWVSSAGPFVSEMEREMAALTGRAHAVATASGTAALHLALLAVGVEPDDYVVVPDWTFIATANAVRHAGATPVFVDVTEESWTLNPALVRELICDFDAGRIAAVIAVHALGHPADMDALHDLGTDVPLIEDAAGAIGARYKGRVVGGLGDVAIFSFNGNKTVTAGAGGMVVTDNGTWADTLRHLSVQARSGAAYEHDAVGFSYRMNNLNAALGVAQLKRLDEMMAAKRRLAARYNAAFSRHARLTPLPSTEWSESNGWLYAVQTNSVEDAHSLVDHLHGAGIVARNFWRSLSSQAPYVSCPRLLTGVSQHLSGRVVVLPSSSSLTLEDQNRVIAAIEAWCSTQSTKRQVL